MFDNPQETIMDSVLGSYFDSLPPELKLPAGQAALSTGLRFVVQQHIKALQEELINLTATDPNQLASAYVMLRMQMMLSKDVLTFFEYAGKWFLENTNDTTT